ncbi:PD-(D/E)XK motif protein [Massilia sp. SR12]
MARRIDEFTLAWKALSGGSEGQGWRTIAVDSAGQCALRAGRYFPNNEESLLAGFSSLSLPVAENLPDGLGFAVSKVNPYNDGKLWVALTRKAFGSADIFTQMVADVVAAMDAVGALGEEKILRAMLSRLRAWQEFMRKGQQPMSAEAEIGLAGELSILIQLIDAGVPSIDAIEGWMGPLDGVQDFELGMGAIEVKSSLSSKGFVAKIGSLEQLDDSVRQPLFIAGARFVQIDSGLALPQIVGALRVLIEGDGDARRTFEDRLIAASYQDDHADRYVRQFALAELRIQEVTEGFPRLVPGGIPDGIRRAIYEIDLDRANGVSISLNEALIKLGVV